MINDYFRILLIYSISILSSLLNKQICKKKYVIPSKTYQYHDNINFISEAH